MATKIIYNNEELASFTGSSKILKCENTRMEYDIVVEDTGGIIPSGELTINENGRYNVTQYASANVNVPSSGNANIEYTAAEGWNGTQLVLNKTFTKYGSYGFVYDSTYGLKPQNQNVHNSFAMCKIPFTISNPCNITVNMYQGSEINYDYGFLSKLDTELGQNYNGTDSNCVDVGAGTSGSKGKSGDFSYTFSNVSAGPHYITIKYRKDGSQSTSPDLFSVKSIVASVTQGTKSKTWVDSGSDIDIVRWADESIPTPTGNIQLSQQTGTNVTNYATASVRSGSVTINTPTVSASGLITASASVGTTGWIGSAPSSKTKQLTTQGAKTVTPSSSSQTAVSSGVYTTGAVTVAAVPTETKTVDLSMTSGNQVVSATSGKFMTSVTVNKPSTLLPENIKKNVNIGGVVGTFEGGGGGEIYDGTVEDVPGMPVVGQIITMNLDGTDREYRVLRTDGNVAEVLAMFSPGSVPFNENY